MWSGIASAVSSMYGTTIANLPKNREANVAIAEANARAAEANAQSSANSTPMNTKLFAGVVVAAIVVILIIVLTKKNNS